MRVHFTIANTIMGNSRYEPIGGYCQPLKSVMRNQCNASRRTLPRLVPNYAAWWQAHMCANNSHESSLRLLSRKSNALTIIPPTTSHNIDNDKQKLPRGNFLVIDKAVVAAAIMSVAGEWNIISALSTNALLLCRRQRHKFAIDIRSVAVFQTEWHNVSDAWSLGVLIRHFTGV